MFYVSLLVTRKQKYVVDTQQTKRNGSKLITIENDQIIKIARQEKRNKGIRK